MILEVFYYIFEKKLNNKRSRNAIFSIKAAQKW